MTTGLWVTILGTVGGFCTTFAFVPQLIKIWRQGGKDLSYSMLFVYLFGVSLWLAYGILTHATAVALTNAATFVLISIATVLKAWTARRDAPRGNIALSAAERG
jgi:MtN3 and saliva related transmembrane protein